MFLCRACAGKDFQLLWKLRDAPYGDLFRNAREIAKSEVAHPFALGECKSCNLLQLEGETDLNIQYDEYLYQSKTTKGLGDYYEKLTLFLLDKIPSIGGRVLDIGSNDGSFLTPFFDRGFEVLGIEPALAPNKTAEKRGMRSIRDYFSLALAEEIYREVGLFDLVSCNYTLANVPNIRDFLEGARKLMKPEGVLSIVTGYHPDQFAVNMWDYIGHDHLSYFSLKTLNKCLEDVGLRIISVERTELKGGSLQVLVKHNQAETGALFGFGYMKQREEWIWPENEFGVTELKLRVERQKEQLINSLHRRNTQYLGIGASISTSYLVNEFELADWIEYLVDDDQAKINRYSPRFGIPVIPFSDSRVKEFNNALILAWQHTEILINRLRQSGFQGNVLVPLPRYREVLL